jgi:hypothetical protein
LHMERAVLSAKAAFDGADEILNIGKSAYTDPFFGRPFYRFAYRSFRA